MSAVTKNNSAPYRFNFHDASGLGNTTIIGPSGSGKTVVQGFLISMLQKAKQPRRGRKPNVGSN